MEVAIYEHISAGDQNIKCRHFPIDFIFNLFITRDSGIQLFKSGIAVHVI